MDNVNRKFKKIEETLNEKQKRRAEPVVHVEKRKAVEKTVDHLYEWVDELHVELSEAKSRLKETWKDAGRFFFSLSVSSIFFTSY